MKVILTSFLFIMFCLPSQAWGQEKKTARDIGVWVSMGLAYELNKDWQFFMIQEIRTFDDAIEFEKSLTDFGIEYRINKQFKLKGGLRYAYTEENDRSYSHNIRYNIDLKFKKVVVEGLDFQYRFRYQSNYENPFTGFQDFKQRGAARNRLKIKKDVKQHALYFSTEVFREYVYYRKPRFSKIRFSLGDEKKTKLGEFDYGLGYERDLNDPNPLHYYFLRLAYTIKVKRG